MYDEPEASRDTAMAIENVFKGVDWSKAPEWAKFWTCDQDGAFWWELQPAFLYRPAIWHRNCDIERCPSRSSTFNFAKSGFRSEDSLVKRPDIAT